MASAAYPLQVDLSAPPRIARWRPLVQWLLAIPQLLVLYVLGLIAEIVWIISFFFILITGNIPEAFFGFQVMVLRYHWRVYSYSGFLREPYPPFEFEMTTSDPGGDPADLAMEYPARLSRWQIFFKWLFAVPHYIVLFFLGIAASFVALVGFFAVIILGRWPEGLRDFLVGVNRWFLRVLAYVYLLTDRYPPFSLRA
jgi:hypothetical protein